MLPQVDSSPESTDYLLANLEAEIARSRAKRAKSPTQRIMVLAGGLFFLFLIGAAALFFLFQMAAELPHHGPDATPGEAILTQP